VNDFCNLYTLYIKKFRILRGYTQEQLADLAGVSQAMIALLEADNSTRKKSPRLELLIRISNALSVCPSDILSFECDGCEQYKFCNKRQYIEEDNEDFFEDNLIYYL
jgi:transcriptional regulator with XRE-family HTH domain